MTTEIMEYRVYGLPIESKSYDLNEDGTLTIIGVASTTNKDYANEIVSPEVLKSLAKQAVGINIYRDHNRHYEGGIGAVVDSWIQDNQLWIKGVILSEYAAGIKERLDIGMNFGFSISGFPKKQRTPEGLLIVDYDLKDITLTYIPMNWDTYGTVEYKSQNLIASNCLTGACYHALNDGEIMSEEETKTEPIKEEPVIDEKDMNDAGLSDAQKNEVKDILNEVVAEIEPRIIDNLKPELETIASDVASKTAEEIAERLIAEFKATTTVQEEAVEEKELPEEECKDESEVIETEEEEVKTEPGISEPENGELEEEEKDESELEEETEDEEEEIDEKSMDEKIHDEIVKQMNSKSFMSKYDQFRKEQSKKSARKLEEKSADNEIRRDIYGRNLDYV